MKGYKNKIVDVLMDFQHIEAALRVIITDTNTKIRQKTKNQIPFKYDWRWVQKDSLGKLIDKFEKITNNTKLTKKLRKLVPLRNEIAHTSLVLSTKQKKDKLFQAFAIRELNKLHEKLGWIIIELAGESGRIENIK